MSNRVNSREWRRLNINDIKRLLCLPSPDDRHYDVEMTHGVTCLMSAMFTFQGHIGEPIHFQSASLWFEVIHAKAS